MYAILDIETTGGPFNEEGITEIAIYKFDGHEVIDQFISLVNPKIPIQPFVVKLTGINDTMLRSAPKFFEIAQRIIEITTDCIIVAHNASFDYRILRTEFRRIGYDFEAKTICTVELAKKMIPEQPSYSLGKLVHALGISMADRHRASGDAMATTELFKILLKKDLEKTIVKDFIKREVEKGFSPKLYEILNQMPPKTGVYYIYNEGGTLIYIGKSQNIKKRVNQHFTGITTKSKKIQAEVFTITYDETGSELIALLKENEAIKTNRPKYNREQRKTIFQYALYAKKEAKGFLNLKLEKADGSKKEITSYATLQEGKNALFRLTSKYLLCQKLTGLYQTKKECFQYKIKECDGACIGKITPETYNARVQQLITENSLENKSMMLIDKGRNVNERSALLIENGVYKGYAFYDLNDPITNIENLKNILIPMQNNSDVKKIIQNYIRKIKSLKILTF